MGPSESSLRVQVVLYGNPLADIWRVAGAVAAAARHTLATGMLKHVELAFGDCSPSPVMTPPDVEPMQTHPSLQGLAQVSYTFFDANLGSAGGSNRLGLSAETEYVMVLNPDTYPAPTALTELLKAVQAPDVGIAEARQIPLEHPKDFNQHTGDTSWASGACTFMRADTFREVGGYDTDNFFLYCDDVDLSWRVRLTGRRVVHVPRAVVFHDKRINLAGHVIPTATEHYYGALGRLMLALKFNAPQILTETLSWIEQHGSPGQRQALAEYRKREVEQRLPAALPGAERVAQFIRGEYAVHRF